MNTAPIPTKPGPKTVAIYCRKSTEEGLDREFNSLDAQRQACEQFAASQRHEGWRVSADRYDDGGFSGGNTERPALQRLLADVEAGKVQVIAVYKLDRMSRSLTDFVGLLQRLDAKQVAFVSVTQHFNTGTPMGRLMLNVLICFAQFERENTIERIRDKVAATKRLGRWCGGVPVLGYDVAPGGRRLVVNDAEADRVRAIFGIYLETHSLASTLQEIAKRGWVTKARTSEAGRSTGGSPFHISNLSRMLGNILYTGRVAYRGEVFLADHPAIVDMAIFEAVQARLRSQHRSVAAESRRTHNLLLRGLLICVPCNCGMTYTWSKRGPKMYAYYSCVRSRGHGAHTCPMPSIPMAELDRMVIDEIAAICRDPQLVEAVMTEATRQQEAAMANLREQVAKAEEEARVAKVATRAGADGDRTKVAQANHEVARLRTALMEAEKITTQGPIARSALRQFEPIWAELSLKERAQLLRLLVERIKVDGQAGKVSFVFRATGIAALAQRAGAA